MNLIDLPNDIFTLFTNIDTLGIFYVNKKTYYLRDIKYRVMFHSGLPEGYIIWLIEMKLLKFSEQLNGKYTYLKKLLENNYPFDEKFYFTYLCENITTEDKKNMMKHVNPWKNKENIQMDLVLANNGLRFMDFLSVRVTEINFSFSLNFAMTENQWLILNHALENNYPVSSKILEYYEKITSYNKSFL